jgi:Flp pilus assembly protein TadG
LVLLAVPLAAITSMAAYFGRVGVAESQVSTAARDAARAASLSRSSATAQRAAHDAARATLAGQSITCSRLAVTTDLRRWRPGGLVAVTVTCTTSLRGLGLAGAPGTVRIRATEAAPLDRNRSVTR